MVTKTKKQVRKKESLGCFKSLYLGFVSNLIAYAFLVLSARFSFTLFFVELIRNIQK